MSIPRNSLFGLLILMVLHACGQEDFDSHVQKLYEGTVPLVRSSELLAKPSDNIVILDTRTVEEYEVSHIAGSRLIDYDSFKKADVKDIPKDAEVIVYCSVGYRSERIGEKLQKLGYANVKNLYGGIFDWKNKGHEVINRVGQPTDSVHTYNFAWSKWLFNGVKVY